MKMKHWLAALLTAALVFTALAASAEETAPVNFGDAFAEHFLADGETPVITEYTYTSSTLSIEITLLRENKSDIYVADIWLSDMGQLRRGFGNGKWRTKMKTVKTIAQQENALLALTGDNGHNFDKGVVFANGVRLRKTLNRKRDVCVIMMDGSMEVIPGAQLTADKLEALTGQVWQSFLFGPGLFDDEGHALPKFSGGVSPANPRAVIGYYEPGHYCLVQVDGRGTKSRFSGKNSGMTLKQLADYMESLGCKKAYNLDGGQSALMWFNGQVISTPYKGGRAVGDIVYVIDTVADAPAQGE